MSATGKNLREGWRDVTGIIVELLSFNTQRARNDQKLLDFQS